jgi:UDP-glucose 4-epimerase
MSHFVLSGASGYLGALCRDWLRRQGHLVTSIGRRAEDDVRIDFAQHPALPVPIVAGLEDAIFIHLAAAHEHICRDDPLTAYRVNVQGTHLALAFCRRNGIGRFLYVSTRHVFGPTGGKVDETDLPVSSAHYGLSHLLSEMALAEVSDVAVRTLRPSNIFGVPPILAECARWTLIPLGFCRQAVEEGRIVLKTSGLQKINLVTGASVAFLASRFGDLPPMRHVVGSQTFTVRAFAYFVQKVLAEEFGRRIVVELAPVPDLPPMDHDFCSLHPPVDIEGDVRDFVRDLCRGLIDA